MSLETVTIDALGAEGDGVARAGSGAVFVPFTLPGDIATIVRHGNRATLHGLKASSQERVVPPCPHFGPASSDGACGGCAMQHCAPTVYQIWKRNLVVRALEARGIECPVEPLAPCRPGARRRLTMSAKREGSGVVLGFFQAGTHRIVPIVTCPVASGLISDRLASLRKVAVAIASGSRPFRLTVLATASGLDIAASGLTTMADRKRRGAIETVLSLPDIARLSVDGEIIIEPRKPVIHMGKATIIPPPGAFLQASASAETLMAKLVCEHLGPAKRVADLFAGCGTFALRLAERSAVHAVEGERNALQALQAGFRGTQGLKSITVERRDLFRSPLMANDLKAYEGVVFDPPYAGAQAQAAELAKSKIARIAAVSCNPATLARDLEMLIAGGYRLLSVKPVDQFLWSAQVETVALLER